MKTILTIIPLFAGITAGAMTLGEYNGLVALADTLRLAERVERAQIEDAVSSAPQAIVRAYTADDYTWGFYTWREYLDASSPVAKIELLNEIKTNLK